MEIISASAATFIVPSGEDCIGRYIKENGRFETDDISRVISFLKEEAQCFSERRFFVDVGANIGTHTIAAIIDYGFERCLAIEPSAANYNILMANLYLNNIASRVSCIQAAASNEKQAKILYHNAFNCGDYRIGNSPHPDSEQQKSSSEIVSTIDLGEVIADKLDSCHARDILCWIDTQGHEIPILDSLLGLLGMGMPAVFEFWPYGMEQQGGQVDDLIAVLSRGDFLLANIVPRGIEKITLSEVSALWHSLRQMDNGMPEKAKFTNLLIYSPANNSISPELRRRIEMTVACVDSHSIPKVDGAGKIFHDSVTPYQLMHNGLKVIQGGYYGQWMSEIIHRLRGHHEPQEELVFHKIEEKASRDGLIIELGCYWAYYSLWFLMNRPSRSAICLEPDPKHLEIAFQNASLNGLSGQIDFIHGISAEESCTSQSILTESGEQIDVAAFTLRDLIVRSQKSFIEIVHCDAQGAELFVVDQIIELAKQGKIRFCIISTHAYEITGNPLTHQICLSKLIDADAHIIAEHDVHESFSGDGLIAASFSHKDYDLTIPLSYNRYCNSLFPNPAIHLRNAIQEQERLKKSLQQLKNDEADSLRTD
jgi:FkbM family methyltransferase